MHSEDLARTLASRNGPPEEGADSIRDRHRLAALAPLRAPGAAQGEDLDRLTRVAARALSAPLALFSLVDEDQLLLKSAFGFPEALHAVRQSPLFGSPCERIVTSSAPLRIEDVARHPLTSRLLTLAALDVRALLGVPVLLGGQTVGTLSVFDRAPRAFSEQDEILLAEIAAALAHALEARRNKALLEHLVASSPVVVFRQELEGARTTYVSPNAEAVLGLAPEELGAGQGWLADHLHPEDAEAAAREATRVASGEVDSAEFEGRLRASGAEARRVRGALRLERDERERPVRLLGTCWDVTEQRRAEAARRIRERDVEAILAVQPEAVFLLDPSGRVSYANDAARAIGAKNRTGDPTGRPYDDPAWKLSKVDGTPIPAEEMPALRVLRTGEPVSDFDFCAELPDGRRRLFSLNAAPLRGETGEITSVVVSVRDVTERKLAERRLEESEKRFRCLFHHNPHAIYSMDIQGRLLSANAATEALTGCGAEELATLGFELFVAPEDRERCRQLFGAALAGRAHSERVSVVNRAGRRVEVQSTVIPIKADGEIVGLFGIAEDVTEKLRAEAALRESEQRFRQLAENITDVFWSTDPDKSVMLYVSPAYEEIWGRTTEELYASPSAWLDAVHPEDRDRITLALPKQAAGKYDETYRIIRPDGTTRWIRDRSYPVRDAAGRLVRVVGAARDVTEQKLLEEQLLHAQKMEAVGQLAGGVAHDFNNLLTAIQGNAELLLEEAGDDPALREGLEEIDEAAVRAASLTRQLLAFSRRQMVQPRLVDPNAVVGDMERMLRRLIGEHIELDTTLDPAPGLVLVDRGQLEQVVMNLVVNARDAIGARGRVNIETRRVRLGEAEAARMPGLRPGDHVVLSVRDDGCGMDESVLAHVFEPFFTTKDPGRGTGLGLATVYGVVRQSGGHVEVESARGRGSAFSVYLPVARTEGHAEAGRRDRAGGSAGNGTVLVVEDEEPVRVLARRVLERAGYRVLVARDGAEALETCRAHEEPIHLLLTDVVLPGMSGRELAERARPLRPGMRVLYVSGYTDDAILRHGILRAEVDLVDKPFFPATLTQAVRRALGERPAPA